MSAQKPEGPQSAEHQSHDNQSHEKQSFEPQYVELPRRSRLGHTQADYQRLGLGHEVATWEDGLRTDGSAGTFEWWYFDHEYLDGSKIVVVFYAKDLIGAEGPFQPKVKIDVTFANGERLYREVLLPMGTPLLASRDRASVQIADSALEQRDGKYFLRFDDGEVYFESELTSTLPMWRPQTGHSFFGEDGHYFAWLVGAPKAEVTSTLRYNGQTLKLTGKGYHDHNWGNVSMSKVMNHWYWARAQVGDYTVIASDVIAEAAYNWSRNPVFFIAKDGHVLSDDAFDVRIERHDVQRHPETGKAFANTLVFCKQTADSTYTVTFERQKDLEVRSLLATLPEAHQAAARAAGLNPTYVRTTGQVTLSIRDHTGEQELTSSGIWEQMYFGANPVQTVNTTCQEREDLSGNV